MFEANIFDTMDDEIDFSYTTIVDTFQEDNLSGKLVWISRQPPEKGASLLSSAQNINEYLNSNLPYQLDHRFLSAAQAD